MPKVSIILPTFNAEKTIDRCIESIIEQTYADWELICCDDCSIDNTYEKLCDWGKKDNRIKVLKNKTNSRAAYTRNRCIEVAQGEYIAQIDDDDYCARDRIEKQVDFLEQNYKYSFVGSKIYIFDEDGIWRTSEPKLEPSTKDFLWSINFSNPSTMIRKEALDRVKGYRVAKETRRSQDYDLFMRLYIEGYRGYNLQEPLTYYYKGKNSYPKCKYEYRVDEAKIRYRNFKRLGLLPRGYIYVIKPLIIGLIPVALLERMKRRRRNA